MQKISSILKMKRELNTDDWTSWLRGHKARQMVEELASHLEEKINPEISHVNNATALSQTVLTVYAGALIQPEYAKIFKDLSEEEIDRLMQSFAFKNCKVNEGLLGLFEKYANQPISR